jgi:hypothetical protein
MRPFLLLVCAALAFAGCSTVQTQKNRGTDLTRHRRVWVESRLNDSNSLDARIVNELKSLGYEAATGPLTMMPEDMELVVTYDARWEWDFRYYLIELTIAVRPAATSEVVARAHYFHPGITRKAPEAMIHELLEPLFHRG